MIIHTLDDFQIRTMYINGIIHHSFIQTILWDNLSLTSGKVCSICLRCKIARIIIAFQADSKTIKRNIFAKLCQQSHTFGIMYFDIKQGSIHIMWHENARSRTSPSTHSHHCAGHQTCIFPLWRANPAGSHFKSSLGRTTDITGIIYHMFRFAIESNAPWISHHPAFTQSFEYRILTDAVIDPWCRFERDSFFRIILYHLYLSNMGLFKINAKAFQYTILRTKQRNRNHPSIKHKFGTLPVNSQVFHILQGNPHFFRIVLVVIGNIIFTHGRTRFMKIVTSGRKTKYHFFPITAFSFNLRYGLTNHRRRIFLTISFQAKLGNVINTLLCTNIRHG